jgi:hypothetical protein
LFIRWFTKKLAVPSVIAVPILNPARWRSAQLTSHALWPIKYLFSARKAVQSFRDGAVDFRLCGSPRK